MPVAVFFVGLFGFLLASFPGRNNDLWEHLAKGRDLLSQPSAIGATWLFDLAAYAVYSSFGGATLALVKAILCGAIAGIIFKMSRMHGGWRLPLASSGLAALAMGTRLFIQPATLSVLFLAIAFWFLQREAHHSEGKSTWWPGWRLVVLFAIWCNIDGRFVIGLAVVALTWFGRLLDSPPAGGFWRGLCRRVASLAILAFAACLSPSHVKGFQVPPELHSAITAILTNESSTVSAVNSPFAWTYLANFRDSPAALAYFPLLALGLLSFLLNRKGWRWAWFLPWLGLGIASSIQVRLAPFFAIVAGPVTAWNLVQFFTNRGALESARPRVQYAVRALIGILAMAFLACAWPGWLQGPPFEPRRWAVEQPIALQQAADFLQKTHANHLWQTESRTLHISSDTASAFAWFCPDDRRLRDDSVVAMLLNADESEPARQRLRTLGVSRVVVSAADPGTSRMMLERLLADPEEWPMLHLTGGVVVFAWRDPAEGRFKNPYEGWEVDFTRLAFRPDRAEVAPSFRPAKERRWWDAFWKPAAPPRPPARDEAMVLFKKSQAMIPSAPFRHLAVWEPGQVGGLVGAASGWIAPAALLDAKLRLDFVSPPIPDSATPNAPLPPITQLTMALQQRFASTRGFTPAGILYSSLRASRRALAESPTDANAYLLLGQTYAALIRSTAEQNWAARLPQLMRLRQLQASAALNRAVALNPNLAEGHIELARLYLTLNYLDLAAVHLRAYRDISVHWGGPRKGDPRADALLKELDRLTEAVDFQMREFVKESAHASVGDRAAMAARRGLAGEARDLLLKSDVSAFGAPGMELELNLLLRTGRPNDVMEWMTPELRGSLGDFAFFWLRAQAYIALGDYDAADFELGEIADPGIQLPSPTQLATEIAGVVGKTLLDARPGTAYVQQIAIRAMSELDFRSRILQTGQRLGRLTDVMVLRGLVALEAGMIDRARSAFRAALSYSPNRWGGGQLEFNGRWVAWECLSLIESADPKPARALDP